MKVLYRTSAKAVGGGREGKSGTVDGHFSAVLSTPKELGGGGGAGTNPEQLFATGYAACFLGALRFVAGKEKVKLPDETTVTASVGIGPRDDGTGFSIEAAIEASIPGFDKAQAEDLVAKAHVVCPYSEATRKNLDVKVTTVV